MLQFDHMTIIAPTLTEGIEHVAACLGTDLVNGTTHVDMGTHNRRVKLGASCYLEVIAIDPSSPPPNRPRWFGLDHAEAIRSAWSNGLRLRAWVARTNDIDTVLKSYSPILGSKTWLDDHYNFSVLPNGDLPLGGVLPSIIDVGDNPPTAVGLEDQGIHLREFVLEHPDPPTIISLYKEIGIVDPPTVIEGDRIALSALISTPNGGEIILR